MQIDIKDENGVVGSLIEITEQPSYELILKMTSWKQSRRKLTQRFTVKQSKRWLDSFFRNDSKKLFWVMEDGKYIGQCGVSNLTDKSAELNYFIRGAGNNKELMRYAGLALCRWLFDQGIHDIYVNMVSTNKRPMELTLGGSFVLAKGYSFDGKYRKLGKNRTNKLIRADLDEKALLERYPWL